MDNIEKLNKELDKKDNIFIIVYYFIYRIFFLHIPNFFREIKYFFQNCIRGYSDKDLWSMDYFLGRKILKHLKAFKKIKRMGYPVILDNTDQEENVKEWEKILDDMIEGFEFLVYKSDKIEEYNFDNKEEVERYKKECKEAQEKAMKFIIHYNSLWD